MTVSPSNPHAGWSTRAGDGVRERDETHDDCESATTGKHRRADLAAHELAVPLIYFRGIASSQYAVVAPAFGVGVSFYTGVHYNRVDSYNPFFRVTGTAATL